MTSSAVRLARVEQRLRLDADHERCPACDGSGLDSSVVDWWTVLRPALDELRADLLARFPTLTDPGDWSTDAPPDPLPAPTQCRVCDATGRATIAAAAAHRDWWWSVWGGLATMAGRSRT